MIRTIKKIYEGNILKKDGVIGVGLGYKIKDGEITDKKCINVFVKEKKNRDLLKRKDVVPKRLLGFFQTDVIDAGGEFKDMSAWRKKHRPLRIGASCSWEGLTACSNGLPLYTDKNWVMMNKHCLNPHGSKEGDRVLQPAPADGGTKKDTVGYLTKYFFPVSSKKKDNIDVALYELIEEMEEVDVVGREYIPETRYLNKGDLLKDIEGGGRTIGKDVTGIIISIDMTAKVRGEENGKNVVRQFKNCVLSLNSDGDNPIVMGGDSSSPRFVDDRPLLQTFAGSEVAAIFNQTQKSIDWFKKEFGLNLKLKKPMKKEGYIALDRRYCTDKKVITNYGLNFRKEPGLDGEIITTLNKGAKFEILEYAGYNDKYHWVKIKI